MNKFLLLLLLVAYLLVIVAHAQNDGFEDGEGEDLSDSSDLDSFRPNMDGYGDPYGDPYGGGDPYGDESMGGPPMLAKELETLEDVEQFIKEVDTEASIIGYFDSSSNAEDLETFKELATTDGRTYRFAFTTSKAVLEAKKYDGCAVVVFPPPKYVNEKMERSKFRYPSKSIANRQQQLLDFIQAKSIPLAGELTSRTSAAYEAVHKPLVTVFGDIDYERNAKNVNYLANRVRKVAKKYEGKVIFSLADTKAFETVMEEDYAFEKVSYKEAQVGLRSEDMFYHMTDKFSVENLASFVDQFLAGSLEGKQKIARASHGHENDDGDNWDMAPVVALTDATFENVVQNPEADVLVEFYAPWCGHCRSLKPEYQRVAEHFAGDAGVTIAAFDATAGSIPAGFDVQGYPTLFYVPANDKAHPVPYEGEREARAIIAFLNAHRTTVKKDNDGEL